LNGALVGLAGKSPTFRALSRPDKRHVIMRNREATRSHRSLIIARSLNRKPTSQRSISLQAVPLPARRASARVDKPGLRSGARVQARRSQAHSSGTAATGPPPSSKIEPRVRSDTVGRIATDGYTRAEVDEKMGNSRGVELSRVVVVSGWRRALSGFVRVPVPVPGCWW
jgi:hypothetical protein